MDKTIILADQLAVELEDTLEGVLPLRFAIGGSPLYLDFAAAEDSDCAQTTVVDQDGTVFTVDILVTLVPVPLK